MMAVATTSCSSDKKDGGEKKQDKSTASKKTSDSKPKPPATPPPGKVVLETVDVPHIGKMLLPQGAKKSLMTKSSGHYRLSLDADGHKSLYIDYETAGDGKTLAQAKSLAGVLAHTAKETAAKTLPSGIHVVERKRDKDNMTWVIAFRPQGYVSCWGPETQLENCRKIAASVPMPGK